MRNKALNARESEDSPSSSIISTFIHLLQQEIRLVKDLAEIVDMLMNTKDFTSYEAFLAIDVDNNKYIDFTSLSNYLMRNGYNLSTEEAKSIIYRLDLDNDLRISYDEFQQIFFSMNLGGNVRSENRFEQTEYKKEEDVYMSEDNFNGTGQNFVESGNNFNRTQDNLSQFDNQAKGTGFSNTYQRSPRPEVSTGTSFYKPRNMTSSVSPVRTPLQYDYSMSPRQPLREYLSSSRRHFSPQRERPRLAEKTLYSPYRVNLTKSPERQRYISPNTSNRSPITERRISPERIQESNNYLKNKTNSALLAKYFYEILTMDVNSESLKEALSVKSDINIRDLFNYFDLTVRNYISLVDMREVLKELDIYTSLDDIKLLYKRFDKDLDGRFEYIILT